MYRWQLRQRTRKLFVTIGVIWVFISGVTLTLSILNGEDLRAAFLFEGVEDIKIQPADSPLREPTEKEILLKEVSSQLERQLDLVPMKDEVEGNYIKMNDLPVELPEPEDDEYIP